MSQQIDDVPEVIAVTEKESPRTNPPLAIPSDRATPPPQLHGFTAQVQAPTHRHLWIAAAGAGLGFVAAVVACSVVGVVALASGWGHSKAASREDAGAAPTANPTFTTVAQTIQSNVPRTGDGDAAYQGKSVRLWVDQLKDKDPDNCLAAANALLVLGPDVKPYSANVEAAFKDVFWDLVQSTIASIGPEEQPFQKVGEPNVRQEETRRQQVKEQKYRDCLLTLVRTLQKADPERLAAMGLSGETLKTFLAELSNKPAASSTFDKVGDTILPPPR